MKFQIKLADGKLATFNSLTELAKHYGDLGDAYRHKSSNPDSFNAGKADAYDIVSWQLASMVITMNTDDIKTALKKAAGV